jgi:hypothetical protein
MPFGWRRSRGLSGRRSLGADMVNELRMQIEKIGRSQNVLGRAVYRGIKALGSLRRFFLSPRVRSQVLTRRLYAGQHFQGETFTCEDRYPELFEECRERLSDRPGVRILSYGCATGEEVFTLARYLPQAELVGVDINRWCLKECARRNTSARIRFLHRMSPEFAGAVEFDAVFCMAVFQRTEHRTAGAEPVETGFTFGRFEDEVRMLDEKLKSGGLLFLDECDFSFEQTAVAAGYRPLEFIGNRTVRRRPLFGRDNQLVASEHDSVRGFVKLGRPQRNLG